VENEIRTEKRTERRRRRTEKCATHWSVRPAKQEATWKSRWWILE
jgi:hypothetical protein